MQSLLFGGQSSAGTCLLLNGSADLGMNHTAKT